LSPPPPPLFHLCFFFCFSAPMGFISSLPDLVVGWFKIQTEFSIPLGVISGINAYFLIMTS
jgi:hypothetical protein